MVSFLFVVCRCLRSSRAARSSRVRKGAHKSALRSSVCLHQRHGGSCTLSGPTAEDLAAIAAGAARVAEVLEARELELRGKVGLLTLTLTLLGRLVRQVSSQVSSQVLCAVVVVCLICVLVKG